MTNRVVQYLGIFIVSMIAIITIAGGYITPRDPRERNVVTKTADGYRSPPFEIGTPGFIFGSDQYGRDIFSRIVAGTQPTMITIIVVATLRLLLGACIGLIGSFARSSYATIAQILIRAVTYLPQLFGSLLILVLAGNNPTLTYFLVALIWSGWGDVAQLVYQRSSEFKQLPVYEAALSSGASAQSILVRHIRRHLAPIWGMLWLREMSNSLALLAMLGFLGYFVGGASWIIVAGDAVPVGARAADIPELGQMLATSFERVLQPQAMFVIGGYIAIILLGFNLLGDWIRSRMSYLPEHGKFGWWQKLTFDAEWALSQLPAKYLFIGLIVILLPASMIARIQTPTVTTTQNVQSAQLIWQANQPWRDARGDASASLRGNAWPTQPTITLLTPPPTKLISTALSNQHGDIVVYTASPGLAIYRTDTQRWDEHPLKFQPIGNPALTSTEEIVVVGPQGFVAHYDFDGVQLRTYAVTTRAVASAGATIDLHDNVYITVVDRIEAFDAQGQWRWASPKVLLFGEQQAQISPDGSLIFLGGEAFDIVDGARLPMFAAPTSATFENPLLISGADGYVYKRRSHQLTQLTVDNFVPTEVGELRWNASQVTMFFPDQTGVTAQGIGWMIYKGFGGIGRFVWLPANQEAIQIPIDTSMRVMFVADNGQFVACNEFICLSHLIGQTEPVWQTDLPSLNEPILGMSFQTQGSALLTTPSQILTFLP